jgi:carbon storage regulator CsrA
VLVLSRRPDENIVFSNLGVKVRILRVQGSLVRIGIEAPPEVKVLRGELGPAADGRPNPRPGHALRNLLNKVNLSLHTIQQRLARGEADRANALLEKVLADLEALDREYPAAPPAPPAPRHRFRTLVVDDNSNERELLAGLLGMNGCECAMAEDGEAALDYLSTHDRPDFVLLDMLMPRCDGAQTIRRVRSDPRYQGLKVFVISGMSPRDMGIETGPGGADAWFTKPLNPNKLWEAMRDSVAGGSN